MSDFDRNKCLQAMKKLSNKVKDRVAGPIWHYTNAEAFKNIIESKEIWMTNASFVNDKMELRTPLERGLFENVEFINQEFNVFKNEPKRPEPEDYYLACFSKDGNSLYQFRAYGNYCIGFDAKKLERNKFLLFRCVYKQKNIKDWIIRKDKFPEWQNHCFDNKQSKSYKRFTFDKVLFARQAKLKNQNYESEKEIRLLVVSNSSWDSGLGFSYGPEMFCDQPAIYFRNVNFLNVQVPYVKFFIPKKAKPREELEKMVKSKSQTEAKQIIKNMEMKQEKERELLPINEIRIGPMPHQEETVLATRIFLRENGYDKVNVTPSDIPFRGK